MLGSSVVVYCRFDRQLWVGFCRSSYLRERPVCAVCCPLAPRIECLLSSDFSNDNSTLPRLLPNQDNPVSLVTQANGGPESMCLPLTDPSQSGCGGEHRRGMDFDRFDRLSQ